jgi:OOP family OmpA-OmpF porin
MVERGLDSGRIAAASRGESEPIASNDDEAGRALNRRVEVECAAGEA